MEMEDGVRRELEEILIRLHNWREYLAPEALLEKSYMESAIYSAYVVFVTTIYEHIGILAPKLLAKDPEFLEVIRRKSGGIFIFPNKSTKEEFEMMCEDDLEEAKDLITKIESAMTNGNSSN